MRYNELVTFIQPSLSTLFTYAAGAIQTLQQEGFEIYTLRTLHETVKANFACVDAVLNTILTDVNLPNHVVLDTFINFQPPSYVNKQTLLASWMLSDLEQDLDLVINAGAPLGSEWDDLILHIHQDTVWYNSPLGWIGSWIVFNYLPYFDHGGPNPGLGDGYYILKAAYDSIYP